MFFLHSFSNFKEKRVHLISDKIWGVYGHGWTPCVNLGGLGLPYNFSESHNKGPP